MKVSIKKIQQMNELYKTMSMHEVASIMDIDRSTVAEYIWKPRTRLETLKIKRENDKKGELKCVLNS